MYAKRFSSGTYHFELVRSESQVPQRDVAGVASTIATTHAKSEPIDQPPLQRRRRKEVDGSAEPGLCQAVRPALPPRCNLHGSSIGPLPFMSLWALSIVSAIWSTRDDEPAR